MTAMETSAGGFTTRFAEPVTEPNVAPMVAKPAISPEAKPAALTVATAEADDVHVTEVVRFFVLESE